MTRKNMTILMLVSYYLAGAAAAAWATEYRHIDAKLSLLALPLMYLAHLGCNAVARRRGNRPECCECHGDIGLFRRLAQHRFCCDEHEERYLAELDKLGVARLQSAIPTAFLPARAAIASYTVEDHAASDRVVALVPLAIRAAA